MDQYLTNSFFKKPNTEKQVALTEFFHEIPNAYNRTDSSTQLWVAGCSISAGEGVKTNDSFSTLLSKKFNKKCSVLATGGASNRHQASKILKADIVKGDIVFWGLTSFHRAPLYGTMDLFEDQDQDVNMYHVNPYTFENPNTRDIINQYLPLDLIYSNHMLYESISAIQEVNNFCNKIGAILILGGILVHKTANTFCETFDNYKKLYKNNHEYNYIDTGNDGYHPGPLQHQAYADEFYNLYNRVTIGYK